MKRMNNHYGKDVFRGARCVMPLDLQFFAEDGSGDDGAAGSGGGGASGDGGNAGKTPEGEKGGESSGMSFDDFLKNPKNQAEFDRRVGKALETNKTKMQADIDSRIEATKTEAEKMAKMNAEQKTQYEREKKDAEIFETFKNRYELSDEEALKLLNTLHDKTSIRELMDALTKDPKNKDLLRELESGAYRARIERLEHLQNEIDRMMQEIYKQEKKVSTDHYVDLASNSYYREIFDIQQQVDFQFSFSAMDW